VTHLLQKSVLLRCYRKSSHPLTTGNVLQGFSQFELRGRPHDVDFLGLLPRVTIFLGKSCAEKKVVNSSPLVEVIYLV